MYMTRWVTGIWRRFAALSGRMKIILGVALAVLIGFAIWAVFFWFAFQTYFVDDEVDETVPVFASGAGQVDSELQATLDPALEVVEPASEAVPSASDTRSASADEVSTATLDPAITPDADAISEQPTTPGQIAGDELSEELAAEMEEVMEAEGMSREVSVEETMPEMPQVQVEVSGAFISRSHPTVGRAEVLGDGTGQRFLRFEEFRTDNGPDLNVYLSTAASDAPAGEFDDDFVDLGDLKGNVGNQNYEIPRDLDLGRYSTVVVWCVRFSVAFGAAELSTT